MIWNFDTAALESIRKQIKSESIETLRFLDKAGKPMLPDSELKVTYPVFTTSVDVLDQKNEKIGAVEITYNKKQQWASFVKDAQLFLFGVGFVVLIQICCIVGVWWSNRKMLDSLGELVKRIQSSSHTTLEKSDQVKETAANVLQLANDQHSSVHETVSALEEIRTMMSKTAENVESSAISATQGSAVAMNGKSSVEKMINAVDEINKSNDEILGKVQNSNEQVRGIVKMIQEISQKTRVINEIVFQTKLLSFNASVEAARAGEHGRGFSVVAQEVGNLATMSGKAAAEIDQLLGASVKRTEEIVKVSTTEVASAFAQIKLKVDAGIEVAKECGVALDQIVGFVSDFKNRMEDVKFATKEQTAGIDSISDAVNKIETATSLNQQNATNADEISKTLVAESSNLSTLVEQMERALFKDKDRDKDNKQYQEKHAA